MSSLNEDDRLSRLPEEISSHILSLMPTKFAVRTSILSKRWRYSWMFVTNLDFDDIHPSYNKKILSKFVDRVMNCCKASQIKLFRLHFSNKWVARSSISSWIDKAVKLNVCELDIQLLTGSHWIEPKLVPACMLTNLTTIKFSICTGLESEIQFLEYMLGNAEVLKTVTITSDFLRAEQEKRLCELQRASRDCEIRFIVNSFY